MDDQRQQATKYHDLGLNTIPVRVPGETFRSKNGKEITAKGKEARVRWKEYQYRPQTKHDIERLFPAGRDTNIAVIGGAVSRNAVCLDFDDREAFTELAKKSPYVENLSRNTISDSTRRGFHLWLRTDKPVKSGENKELHLDIQGESSIWVAPNSVWKKGHQIGNYLFETWNEILTVPVADLNWLGVREAPPRETHNFLELGYKRWTVLKGESNHKDKSLSEYRLILSLVAQGETREFIHEIFIRYSGPQTHYARHSSPVQWLDNAYAKARDYYRHNARAIDREIMAAMHAVREIPFHTYTDRVALLAILQKCREIGTTLIYLSVRELSGFIGVGYRASNNTLHRLIEAGFLSQVFRGGYGLSARYRVETGNISKRNHTNTSGGEYGVIPFCKINDQGPTDVEPPSNALDSIPDNPIRESSLDGFSHRALGKTGLRIVEYLNSHIGEWFTLSQLKDGTGISYNTVKQKMVDLGSLVHVEETPSRGRKGTTKQYAIFKHITNSDVETIAERMGVAGTGKRRQKRYDQEREAYRTHLSDRG